MGRTIHLYDKTAYEAQMAAEIPTGDVVDFFGKA
jgi:MraZ protein